MGDHPIIFSGPMVRALLAGRKTQTRRLAASRLARCQPGDRLWVRESFALASGPDGGRARWPDADYVLFKDGAIRFRDAQARQVDRERAYRRAGWWPAFLMRRWASRLTLIVDEVRIQPLNAIDRADAVREGPLGLPFAGGPVWLWPGLPGLPALSPIDAVRSSWDKVRGTSGERWEDNPDVVALTFRVEERNIDEA
jgi:hypothetical protein